MKTVLQFLLSGIAVAIAAYLLPGVEVDNFLVAVIVAVVLGLLNTFVKPVLVLLSLPVTILTLGLFLLVINALVIILTDALVPGFMVENWLWALLFSFVLSIVNALLARLQD